MRWYLSIVFTGGICVCNAGLVREVAPGNSPLASSRPINGDEDLGPIMDTDPMLKTFMKDTPHIPFATQAKLENDILKEANALEEGAIREQGGCDVDWNAPCPSDWKIRDNTDTGEKICVAPKNYTGFCKTSVSFQLYNDEAKIDWASACDVKWPCKGDDAKTCPHGRDFSKPCPEAFLDTEDGSCMADISQYRGMCQGKANFRQLSDDAKKSWSEACGAFWPCAEHCEGEYDALCPIHWTHIGEYQCIAGESYNKTGQCFGSQNFKYYIPDMKQRFEVACGVQFPCENTCMKNYNTPCPKGWRVDKENCIATAQVSCGVMTQSFVGYSDEDKKMFENTCDVEWPCSDTSSCEIDWSQPCPEAWTKTESNFSPNKEMPCRPPENAPQTCPPASFENYSEEQRRKWSSNCKTPWPCKNGAAAAAATRKERIGGIPSAGRAAFGIAGRRPRPVYHVGTIKRGPVHHVTGEIMPFLQSSGMTIEDILGVDPNRERRISEEGVRRANEMRDLRIRNKIENIRKPGHYEENLAERVPRGYFTGGYYLKGSSV